MLVKVVVQRGDEPTRRNGWLARRRRSGELRATPQPGRRRGWRCSTDRGGSDVGRRSGEAAGMAGDGGVVATPLVVGEDASLVISPRNGGEAGEEEAAATPGEVTAQPDGARARRERRLEAAGAKEREGRRRERSSGGLRGKRRASRGRGSHCDAGRGDGTAGRCTGEVAQAAGGGRRRGRERRAAGRGGEATGERGRGLKLENGSRGFHFIGEEREPATGKVGTAAEKAAGGHGSWPELARAFPAIGGTIQGGNWGELKRIQWGLIPPNQFGKKGIDSRGFRGGTALGFRGERERRPAGGGRRPHVLRACGEQLGVGQVAGWRSLGRAGRREGRGGPEGGGEEGVGREREGRGGSWAGRGGGPRGGGREGEGEKEREERETLGWAWPKGGRGFIFSCWSTRVLDSSGNNYGSRKNDRTCRQASASFSKNRKTELADKLNGAHQHENRHTSKLQLNRS
uniref:OSJNBb0046P18.2 protein n=1 Tax=Oryza sativa subsp. japonica TaxID=39947 RepID=Q7XQ58_ORYSJ|nr:OSJNBb0046P18.2 [Oryza sativa Japonica Group]